VHSRYRKYYSIGAFAIIFLYILFFSCSEKGNRIDPPQLRASPGGIDFGVELNSAYLTIDNVGDGTLTWQIVEEEDWLSVDMTAGSTMVEIDTIIVSVDRREMTIGNYIGEVTIESNGGYSTIAMTMGVPSITDIDGNVYKIVKIRNQWWMAENLKVTHYRNGDAISNVTDINTWSHLSTGAYCDYDNYEDNVSAYGRLYNFYAVIDDRNIAPEGWHVPDYGDWMTLINYLGGYGSAGGKMKEAGIEHWQSPNAGATNESGYSALPCGYRSSMGTFSNLGSAAFFWTSTELGESPGYAAWYVSLSHLNDNINVNVNNDKTDGYSIRCVKY